MNNISIKSDSISIENDILIENKYRINNIIGKGSFGVILSAHNTITKEDVAIKIEDSDSKLLRNEARIYKLLNPQKNIPIMRSYGKDSGINYLVLDLLGKSLEEIKRNSGGKISMKSALIFGISALDCIKNIHKCGIIHRDIKSENFLIGRKMSDINKIYLIDFGLARRYIDTDGKHIEKKEGRSMTGTAHYASIHVHEGIRPSRRDDIESLGYIIIYLILGSLPWSNTMKFTKEIKNAAIRAAKNSTPVFELFSEAPAELSIWISYCRKLEFDEEPDYDYLKGLLHNLLTHHGFTMVENYDWRIDY